jgi:glycosyltransferase involved in cell wall biosynthesis
MAAGGRPAVAYLLPGLPPEGSGGSHSLVQEARGMRALGARSRICVPEESLATAHAVYGADDGLFTTYAAEAEIAGAVEGATVVVATEHPSLQMLATVRAARPDIVCAYYVQDYEPLFAPPDSPRHDRALLSYAAVPGGLLFAKTHWLRNIVIARHGLPVAKVVPSLDRELFHAAGRGTSVGPRTVVAMVRPRTPRRRPLATLHTLAAIRDRLGPAVRTVTFGCDRKAYAELGFRPGPGHEHLGLLSRAEVAALMRQCDLFIDGSAYQAFGRTGLEAMACGAVPMLPALGGVREYAREEVDAGETANAVLFSDDRPEAVGALAVELLRDGERLERLRGAGVATAAQFSIERAARSQLDLFKSFTHRHGSANTVPA